MSFKDSELRAALEDLAGDPIQDADRVLRNLPSRGLPPVTWWLLASGLVAGLVCGIFLTDVFRAEPDWISKPTEPEAKKKQDQMKPMNWGSEPVLIFGLGPVSVTEPGKEAVPLTGSWRVAFDSVFETNESLAGMLLPEDVQVRLNRNTVMRVVDHRRLSLNKGQVYLYTGSQQDGVVAVETSFGVAEARGGIAMVSCDNQKLELVCILGQAVLKPKGIEPIVLGEETVLELVDGQKPGKPQKVEFMCTRTSWMSELIMLQEDVRELHYRISKLVAAYEAGRFRQEAIVEIRKLRGHCVPHLVELVMLSRPPTDHSLGREAANLVGELSERENVQQLFRLLYSTDPEVRVTAYRAIYRITGRNAGTGDKFWRSQSSPEEREKVTKEWYREVVR